MLLVALEINGVLLDAENRVPDGFAALFDLLAHLQSDNKAIIGIWSAAPRTETTRKLAALFRADFIDRFKFIYDRTRMTGGDTKRPTKNLETLWQRFPDKVTPENTVIVDCDMERIPYSQRRCLFLVNNHPAEAPLVALREHILSLLDP